MFEGNINLNKIKITNMEQMKNKNNKEKCTINYINNKQTLMNKNTNNQAN